LCTQEGAAWRNPRSIAPEAVSVKDSALGPVDTTAMNGRAYSWVKAMRTDGIDVMNGLDQLKQFLRYGAAL
jgi:hypothetical protein